MVFQPEDLIWIHLRKEIFTSKRKNKLMPRAEGPCEILEKVNDNVYKVDLPGDYGVSATFNVVYLSPYHSDDSSHIQGFNLFNRGRMMESSQANTLIMIIQIRKVQEHEHKFKGWLTFC